MKCYGLKADITSNDGDKNKSVVHINEINNKNILEIMAVSGKWYHR